MTGAAARNFIPVKLAPAVYNDSRFSLFLGKEPSMLKRMLGWGACLLVAIGAIAFGAGGAVAGENPLLHPLFADNAVIQRGIAAPVWGWTAPNTEVAVTLADSAGKKITDAKTTSDAQGRWEIRTAPTPAGGPYTLTVAAGAQTITAKNVLFGDVWVCSGQSNMEMGIGAVNNAAAEIADAKNYPQLRLFHLPHKISLAPITEAPAEWLVAAPETVVGYGWAGFSATGYFFGRDLQKALDIPIGLIHTSWGGTIAEAWTSEEGLLASGDAGLVNQIKNYVEAREDFLHSGTPFEKKVEKWWAENDKGVAANWSAAAFDDSAWKIMKLPVLWENADLPNFDGLVWFRKNVEIPATWTNQELILSLGPIDDWDTTYVNGKEVGATSQYNAPRNYKVPAGTFVAGNNLIAVRVFDSGGGGGIYGAPEQLLIKPVNADDAEAIKLAGEWKYEVSTEVKDLKPFPHSIAEEVNVPTVLYNGMVFPFLPAAVKGAIWYQGESNAERRESYQPLLTALINDWRARFTVSDGKFPFGIVMLAGFMKVAETPVQNSDWPALREAQLLTAATVKDAGVISAVDLGDTNDIHPHNKQDVGGRLARLMLHDVYGKDIVANGPIYRDYKIDGNKIVISFDNIGGGLIAKDHAPLKWFAIAGEDKNFVAATAEIVGDTVVVTAPSIAAPVAVRYAWADNPDGANLYNKDGLPAFPFRTDRPRPAAK
jgi:sialate O-acetylesterase